MIVDYLLRSGLSLLLLWMAYRFLLEGERLHGFNRWFLLFSLVFGLVMPLVVFESPSVSPLQQVRGVWTGVGRPGVPGLTTEVAATEMAPDYWWIVYGLYFLGLLLLLGRMVYKLIRLAEVIRRSEHIPSRQATLVLIPKPIIPHSFLGYIFISEDDYLDGMVDERILLHEEVHVAQRHSLDVLFVELIRIVFWFNPLLLLYKHAIQLNHEFLADESVVSRRPDIPEYQLLLLRSLGIPLTTITSNINYSLTKKRLVMMRKTTSPVRSGLVRLAVVPVIAFSLLAFSDRNSPVPRAAGYEADGLTTERFVDGPITRDVYFKGATIWVKNKAGKYESKRYEQMTAAEKAALPPVPEPIMARRSPTDAQLLKWKNDAKFRIMIDDKEVDKAVLGKYAAGDFAGYMTTNIVIPPHKSTNTTSKTQYFTFVTLATASKYDDNYIKPRLKPGKELTVMADVSGFQMYVGPPKPEKPGVLMEPVMIAP